MLFSGLVRTSLVSLLLFGCSGSTSTDDYANGNVRQGSLPLTGSQDATSAYPEFVVTQVTVSDTATATSNLTCSGFLLSPTVAVTAGGCFQPDLPAVVIHGADSVAIIDHVSFSTIENNIALVVLRLASPINVPNYATIRRRETNEDTVTIVGASVGETATFTAHMVKGNQIQLGPDFILSSENLNGEDGGAPIFLDGTHEVVGLLEGASDCTQTGMPATKCNYYARFNSAVADQMVSIAAAWAIHIDTVPAPDPKAVATVYGECGETGLDAELEPGDYASSDLGKYGFGDNSVSSLKVKKGYEVILYDGAFSGKQITITEDTPCLTSKAFDKLASSFRVKLLDSSGADAGAGAGGASSLGGAGGGASQGSGGSTVMVGGAGSDSARAGSGGAAPGASFAGASATNGGMAAPTGGGAAPDLGIGNGGGTASAEAGAPSVPTGTTVQGGPGKGCQFAGVPKPSWPLNYCGPLFLFGMIVLRRNRKTIPPLRTSLT